MTSHKDCDLELLRLLQMHMEYDLRNLDAILRLAEAFAAGRRHDLTPDDAEFLALSLFRYGRISEARAVVQRRTALRHPLHAFDTLINSYDQLLRFDLRIPEPRHAPLFPGPAEPGKPRVLSFLHSSLPHQTSGYTLRSQALLENTGLDVASFTRIGFPWTADILKNTKSTHRAEVNRISYRSVRGGIANNNETFANIAPAKRAIVRLISQRRPDVVHAASNFTNALPAILAARQCGVPFVYEMRGFWELTNGVGVEGWTESERYRLEKSIETAIAKASDRVIVLSDVQRDELVERGVALERISVVPNGHAPPKKAPVTFGFIAGVRARIGRRRVVGYVGAIARYEGLQDLVAVMARRPEALADTAVVIAGDGPFLGELRRMVEREGLEDQVILLGRVPQADALALYGLMDLCILPRTPSEVTRLITPLKLVEALSLGKVLLLSDVPAMAEQAHALGFGELFRAGVVGDLQQRLIATLDNLAALRVKYAGAPAVVARMRAWSESARLWDEALADAAASPRADDRAAADTLGGIYDASPAPVRSRIRPERRVARVAVSLSAGERLLMRGPALDPSALRVILVEAGKEIAVQAPLKLAAEIREDESLYDLGTGYAGEAEVFLYADRAAWPWEAEGRFHLFAQPAEESKPRANLRKLVSLKPENRDITAMERRHRPSQEAELEVVSHYQEEVRVAVSYLPLEGAQLQPTFDKLPHSKSIGARFVYHDLVPGTNLIRLLPRLAGPYLLEVTPWGEGQLGAPSRLGELAGIGYTEREGAWRVELDPAFTNVLVAANINEALLDGSVVWLATLVSALAEDPAVRVYVATNATLVPSSLTSEIFRLPNVAKLDLPITGPGKVGEMADEIERIDRVSGGFDAILVRGPDLIEKLDRRPLNPRTIVYAVGLVAPETVEDGRIADAALAARLAGVRAVIVQQEAVAEIVRRSLGERTPPIHVIPPAVPAALLADPTSNAAPAAEEAMVVYAGKLVRHYGLLELLDAAEALEREISGFRLVILGGKFSADDPEFEAEFTRKVASARGVVWLRAVSQAEALAWTRRASAAWAWRPGEFEAAHFEVSTKMAEAIASGTPPVVYPSPANVALLGETYPGFARTGADARVVLQGLLGAERAAAARALADRGLDFRAAALYAPLRESVRAMARERRGEGARILISSHDFRFIENVESQLDAEGVAVNREYWRNHTQRLVHDAAPVRAGDVVHCEWCLGNAVWWSHNLPDGVRLTIRLHLQEVSTDYPAQVDWTRVSRLVFVSPAIMRQAIEKFAIPEQICEVVPISVALAPPGGRAAAERRMVLGMVGLTPWRKRPDLALELFERLRVDRPELVLRLKGAGPSEYVWMAQREDELVRYQDFFRRLRELQAEGAVRFDGYDAAMEAFYAEVGWVLSVSDFEGCHTAIAEGGVMGCVPLMLRWPGADEVYAPRWSHDDLDALQGFFESVWPRFDEVSAEVAAEFDAIFPLARVWPAWRRLLLG